MPADAGGVFVRWLEVDLLAAQNCPLDLYLTLSYIAKLTVRNALMTRYVAFISENPSWPNIGLQRRRAEAALWKERLDSQTVRASHKAITEQEAQCIGARAVLASSNRAQFGPVQKLAARLSRLTMTGMTLTAVQHTADGARYLLGSF